MKMMCGKIKLVKGGVLGMLAALAASMLTLAAAEMPKIVVSDQPIDRDGNLPASFAPIVKKVAPCVVNIYSTRTIKMQRFLNDPFLQRFFGDQGEEGENPHALTRKMQSLGSGVIISPDGYIITNNHVVDGADDVKVALTDDDQNQFTAKVVGSDPMTDVAVLKIDAKNLKAITLADSDQVEVGDVVLAVGNPFAVGQTVTKGIVSAIGRGGLGIVNYEDFIQTDAAINPGNSGGALVDIEGRLIGINQSIESQSGGSEGVGFAVPINLARTIMVSLVTNGSVRHGYLGVMLQPVTPDLAQEFNLPDEKGALVGEVMPNTPAARAGLKEGDDIIAVNGKAVNDARHLRLVIAQTPGKTKVDLKIIRDGKEQTVAVTVGVLPKQFGGGDENNDEGQAGQANSGALDGVDISDLDANARQQFGVPERIKGALITNVEQGSAAAEAGLRAGDVIVGVNHQPVPGADAVAGLVSKAAGDRLLLRVWSKAGGVGATRYVVIDISGKK
jgi:serine protease Do